MMHIENQMRRAAQQSMQGVGSTRYGTVTGYDPATFSATVKLQPEGVSTGWLPIETLQVGAGWGICAAPNIGDLARVEFQEGDMSAGMVTGFFFNDSARPPAAPAGEFWLVREDGGCLKFTNNGDLLITATNCRIAVDGVVAITGNLSVTGNVSAGTGATGTFTTPTGQVVMVQNGIITNIY